MFFNRHNHPSNQYHKNSKCEITPVFHPTQKTLHIVFVMVESPCCLTSIGRDLFNNLPTAIHVFRGRLCWRKKRKHVDKETLEEKKSGKGGREGGRKGGTKEEKVEWPRFCLSCL